MIVLITIYLDFFKRIILKFISLLTDSGKHTGGCGFPHGGMLDEDHSLLTVVQPQAATMQKYNFCKQKSEILVPVRINDMERHFCKACVLRKNNNCNL